MRFTKRKYLDRQPQRGDTIEVTVNSPRRRAGTELIIISVESFTGDSVRVFDRRRGEVYFINDAFYRIYKDVTYEHLGYNTEVKRFLGIPIYKKTTEIIREV